MTYFKIGVHGANGAGPGSVYGDYVRAMKDTGKPAIVQATDNAGVCLDVQNLGRDFDVISFRLTNRDDTDLDRADYSQDPTQFAQHRFNQIVHYWPPELNPAIVWTCPINEPSKEESEAAWLAKFTLEYGKLSVSAGRRSMALGWSGGTPEAYFWELPDMLSYLRLCEQNPDLLGVNVHEYSFNDFIMYGYPYFVGRFQFLHDTCDEHGIVRPPIIVGEWGWHENELTIGSEKFAEQLAWANEVYTPHDNILGCALWTLGSWHGTIAGDVAGLMPILIQQAMNYEYTPVEPPEPIPPPNGKDKHVSFKIAQEHTRDEWQQLAAIAYDDYKRSMTAAHTAAINEVQSGDDETSYGIIVDPHLPSQQETIAEFEKRGLKWKPYQFRKGDGDFKFTHWPTLHEVVTQEFLANPQNYQQFGFPGHEGVDIRALHGESVFAVAEGRVYRVENEDNNNYGIHVRIEHVQDYKTIYAHLEAAAVTNGQQVRGGELIGWAGDTGNSFGSHLHLTLKRTGYVHTDRCGNQWSNNIFDPTPYLAEFDGVQWPGGSPGFPCPGEPEPPPVGQLVNVTKYFYPHAGQTYGEYIVFHFSHGGTQPQQLQRQPDGSCVLWKGEGRWWDNKKYTDYEHWRVSSGQVMKYIDTSDAGNDGKDAYNLHWAQWIPEEVRVGQVYVSQPTVTRFDRTTCQIHSESPTTDYLHIKELIPHWVSPWNADISYDNVLVIEWRKTPDLNTPPIETYKFAAGVGYVEWNNGGVGERYGGREPLGGELTNCF